MRWSIAVIALVGLTACADAPPVNADPGDDAAAALPAQEEPRNEQAKTDIAPLGPCIRLTDSGPGLGYSKTWFSFVNGCRVPVYVYWCDRLRSTNACSTSNFGHLIDLVPRETEWSWYDNTRFNGVVMAACPQKAPTGEEVQIETVSRTPLDADSPYRCFYYRKSS